MSFFKYYGEKTDADGERLWWPGGPEGYPFRGTQPPQTTESEYQNLQLSGKFRCRLFYLSKEEDVKEYTRIRDKCTNNLFFPVDRDREWDEDSKNYRIYLEWVEPAYNSAPAAGATDAVKKYTQSATTILPYDKLAGVKKDW